jgi:hypothetical protein
LPRPHTLLEQQGFNVAVHDDAFQGRFRVLKVVIGTKR